MSHHISGVFELALFVSGSAYCAATWTSCTLNAIKTFIYYYQCSLHYSRPGKRQTKNLHMTPNNRDADSHWANIITQPQCWQFTDMADPQMITVDPCNYHKSHKVLSSCVNSAFTWNSFFNSTIISLVLFFFSSSSQLYVWWWQLPCTRLRKTASTRAILRKAPTVPPISWPGSASPWLSSAASCTWCSGSANRCDKLDARAWRFYRIQTGTLGHTCVKTYTFPQQPCMQTFSH